MNCSRCDKQLISPGDIERGEHRYAHVCLENFNNLKSQLKNWNVEMSKIAAGSEFHNNPEAYVRRFREHSDAMMEAVKKRREAEEKLEKLKQ